MQIKYCLILFFLFNFSSNTIFAQNEEDKIKETIRSFFDGMRQQDTSKINQLIGPAATLETSSMDKEAVYVINSTELSDFIGRIANAKGNYLDEKITSWDIKINGGLASVWVDYLFYLNGTFSHCGVDAFQLGKVKEKWQILHIMDTRMKEGCIQNAESEIDAMLNKWHHAAAVADEEVFFGSMTADGIYIGTDATEHWLRDTMAVWAQPYFERDTAWAFTPIERNIFIDENGKIAWFDELLDTWMGTCRSSGVVVLENNRWKIKHYHLSVAVPNEIIQDYIKLIGQ